MKKFERRMAVITLIAFLFQISASHADTISIGSQAGAQIFFNNTLTRTYNFGITQTGAQNGVTINSFDVNVKGNTSQSTLSPVLISVYNGLGGTGSVLASGTIAASSLNNTFQFINMPLASPLILPTGGYSVVLTTTNSADYYIKAGPTKLTTNGTTSVTSSYWVEDTNTSGTAGNTLNAASAVLATYTLGTNAMVFGNYRVGSSLSGTTPIVNTALLTSNTMTQALAVSGTTSGGLTSLTGLPSPYLSAGGTSNVVASLSGATTGPNSGTATLSFNSVPGTSLTSGTTAVGSGTLTLSGTGWNWANAKVSSGTLAFGNVRTGSAATSQTVGVGNQAVSLAAYQDLLDVSGSTTNAKVSATGFQNLVSSTNGATTSNVTLAANTASAGSLASTVSLTFGSDANGVAGLSSGTATFVSGTAPTITTTGGVYDWANAKVSAATLAFGNVRTGSSATSQTVAIGNQTVTNASFQDLLNVSGSTNNAAVSATGFSNLAPSTSGTSTSNLSLAANTATAGSLASTVALTYTSNANGVAGLSNGSATIVGGTTPAITTTGGVYDFATAAYSGTAFAFGYLHRGAPAVSGSVAIGNQAITNASYQDSLNVSASTGNPLVSTTGFTGLAASAGGATQNNLVIAAATGTAGSLASTLALTLVSNANGVVGLSNGTASVVGGGSITTTGTVFTGQSTWNTNGSGQWGTLASDFGTNWDWSTFDGSPGVDAGFTDTDTATFGNVVTGGTATVTITHATPSVKSVTFDNAAAAYVLAGASGGSLALLNAGTASALMSVASGSHTIASAVALDSNATIDAAAGTRLSIDGILSGARNLAKSGPGTAVLSGSNTYGGTTLVVGGRLLIHGNQSAATGAITVDSGATLGGRGTAGGAVTVLAGGTLSPGASIESLAAGATTLSGTSTFFYELDSSASLSAAADLLVSNGNLTIGTGAILDLVDLAGSPAAFAEGTKFSLISYGTSVWNAGLFTYQSNELTDGETFTAGLNQWEINYNDTTGGSNFTGDQLAGLSVTITAVPEPSTLAILAAGLVAMGLRLRRRRA